jgi:VRR-NUC domain
MLVREGGRLRIKEPETEQQLQRRVVKLLNARALDGVLWFAVPNGGIRDGKTASILRLTGVRPGIPDILLLHRGRLHGLELKTARGKISEEQQTMLADMTTAGARVYVAYGYAEVVDILVLWGLISTSAAS